MRIGIDISQIIYGGGVSIYTENLVKNLIKCAKKDHFTLFFSSLRQSLPEKYDRLFKSKNSRIKKFNLPQTALDFLWNRIHIVPPETFLGKIDVFHSSDWTQPPTRKAKAVTTIHDLSFLRWPKSVHPDVLKVQKRRLGRVKKEADHIIAVSLATKKRNYQAFKNRAGKNKRCL